MRGHRGRPIHNSGFRVSPAAAFLHTLGTGGYSDARADAHWSHCCCSCTCKETREKSCHPQLPFISLPRGQVFSHQGYFCSCGDVFFSPVTHCNSLVPGKTDHVCHRLPWRQRDVNQLGIVNGLRKIGGKTRSWSGKALEIQTRLPGRT